MKNLKDILLIQESQDHELHEICLQLDHNETVYKQNYWPLVQNLVKKHKKGDFDIKKLEQSMVVGVLIGACMKAAKVNTLAGENRKKLRKLVVADLLKTISDEGETLTKEEEDYMIQWDYNDSKVLNW